MTSNLPLVSVVIPLYNSSSTVQRAVDSIIVQTYKNIEIIVVDDGSSDDSYSKLSKYYSDSRVHIYRTTNRGISATLNFAISQASGSYVARMDSDDFSFPTRIEQQVLHMIKYNVHLLGTNCIYSGHKKEFYSSLPLNHNDCAMTLTNSSPFVHPTIIFDKQFYSYNNLSYSNVKAEDIQLWHDFVMCGATIGNLSDHLLIYNLSDNSLSSRNALSITNSRANTCRIYTYHFISYLDEILRSSSPFQLCDVSSRYSYLFYLFKRILTPSGLHLSPYLLFLIPSFPLYIRRSLIRTARKWFLLSQYYFIK